MDAVTKRALASIREEKLVAAGDRVGVAVSGGADSIALLRAFTELREQLGVVLSVVHFNHRIRGAESDADERFVRDLAGSLGLEFFCGSGDAPALARRENLSLEAAARSLRYQYFWKLLARRDTSISPDKKAASANESGLGQTKLDRIATAHTLDDQAETVLMRLLRGTGTKGLAGIHPVLMGEVAGQSSIIRPMLRVRHSEVEAYLRLLGQPWREDSSNRDLRHTRNRVRNEVMPHLEELNPSIAKVLAESAEIARAEEDYWNLQTERLLAHLVCVRAGKDENPDGARCISVDIDGLDELPLALQRRVLRAAASRAKLGTLDFERIEELRRLAARRASLHPKQQLLPGGAAELVKTTSGRELRLRSTNQQQKEQAPGDRDEHARPLSNAVTTLGTGAE